MCFFHISLEKVVGFLLFKKNKFKVTKHSVGDFKDLYSSSWMRLWLSSWNYFNI